MYNINQSYVPHTVATMFGDIAYKRTYYCSKIDSSHHFLLDEELGFKKYDYVVKALSINNSFQTNQKKTGKIIGTQLSPFENLFDKNSIKTIPSQSIHNWISKWNVPNFNYPERGTLNTFLLWLMKNI